MWRLKSRVTYMRPSSNVFVTLISYLLLHSVEFSQPLLPALKPKLVLEGLVRTYLLLFSQYETSL